MLEFSHCSVASFPQCSPWPDKAYVSPNQGASPSFSSTPLSTYTASSVPDRYECAGVCVPLSGLRGCPRLLLIVPSVAVTRPHPITKQTPAASPILRWGCGVGQQTRRSRRAAFWRLFLCRVPQQLSPTASIQDTQKWLLKNRFNSYARLFSNFSGTHVDDALRHGWNGGNNTDFLTCQVLIYWSWLGRTWSRFVGQLMGSDYSMHLNPGLCVCVSFYVCVCVWSWWHFNVLYLLVQISASQIDNVHLSGESRGWETRHQWKRR